MDEKQVLSPYCHHHSFSFRDIILGFLSIIISLTNSSVSHCPKPWHTYSIEAATQALSARDCEITMDQISSRKSPQSHSQIESTQLITPAQARLPSTVGRKAFSKCIFQTSSVKLRVMSSCIHTKNARNAFSPLFNFWLSSSASLLYPGRLWIAVASLPGASFCPQERLSGALSSLLSV